MLDFNFHTVAQQDGSACDRLVLVVENTACRNAAGVEGTHGELRARLADGLGGDDADRHADFDRLARRHVLTVAASANAARRRAGERRAHEDAAQPKLLDLCRNRVGDDLVALDDHHIGHRIDDGFNAGTTADDILQRDINFLALVEGLLRNTSGHSAIVLEDDDRLRHIAKLAREVSRVRRLQRGIGETLTGAVR